MAFKAIDRAKEQASTSGTGDFTLPGSATSPDFQAFVTKLTANGDKTFYCAVDGSDWETGVLTRESSTTFSRTVYDNSLNTTAAIDFAAAPMVFSTVPGAALAPLGGAAFSAYASADQAVSGTTLTVVTLGGVEYDTNDCFASSKFTADAAGIYHFSGAVGFTTSGSLNSVAYLRKNGVKFKDGAQLDANHYTIVVSSDIALAAGDYVELGCYTSTGRTVSGAATSTYLNGHMVRAL